MSDELKGVIILLVFTALGWFYKEIQTVIKKIEGHDIKIEHLELDNKQHKDNHKELLESLFEKVLELKQDISDLKESFNKQNSK